MALESHEFVDFLLMCEPGVSYALVSQESDLESVRTLGFECASEEAYRSFYPMTGKDQDQLARLHVCLVPYDDLGRVDEMVQRVEGAPRSMSFKDVGKVFISHLAEIVRTSWDATLIWLRNSL